MNANENNKREGQLANINPDEIHFTPSAKEIKAQEKIDIRESGLGREQGQTPADEHIESNFSQIDDGTKNIQQSESGNKSQIGESKDTAGYMNDETSADRDTGNQNGGWESSKTSRHK